MGLSREKKLRLRNMKELTNNLSGLIAQRDMTYIDLADLVGIRRGYANKIANGYIKPNVVLALKIAKALEVSVEDIFGLPEDR